jgi:hypothetical protein
MKIYFTKEEFKKFKEIEDKFQTVEDFENYMRGQIKKEKRKHHKPMEHKKRKDGRCAYFPECPNFVIGDSTYCEEHKKKRNDDSKDKWRKESLSSGYFDKSESHDEFSRQLGRMIREGCFKTPEEIKNAINNRSKDIDWLNQKIQDECFEKDKNGKWRTKSKDKINQQKVKEFQTEVISKKTQCAILKRLRQRFLEKRQGMYGNLYEQEISEKKDNFTEEL